VLRCEICGRSDGTHVQLFAKRNVEEAGAVTSDEIRATKNTCDDGAWQCAEWLKEIAAQLAELNQLKVELTGNDGNVLARGLRIFGSEIKIKSI
jgi:hypothetical protein